ncbi:nucleotidyltransferase family protein [Demequina soli]|uniref:nucleotidyltransferase family protein n=1 Tax=Demequina soli TaxID=1638987 RepID=UPI0007836C7B|nr:nucleotidyltransferase family protein [Demequina soli]
MTDAALPIDAAVPLAHALAVDVARRTGVRALIIKGPTAAAHCLRPERVSADVDVWVEPVGLDAYLAALEDCGWAERPYGGGFGPKAEHSVTVIHPQWPCDIDVHHLFPGFLAPTADVFDALWARREQLALAGVEVDMVDRSSAILIAALHALRTPAQTPRHAQEIRRLAAEVLPALDHQQRADLVLLATATGAIDTARPVLEQLGVPLAAVTPHGESAALDAWRARVGGRGAIVAQWIPLLVAARWYERPTMLARMIWPTERQFRAIHPETPPGSAAALRGRWSRIGRGLRTVPRALRGRALARRGITDASILTEEAR